MMAEGNSIGVFQFESDGMRDALRKVKPTEFEDLVALVALYRPGAMRHIDTYARNKRNPDAVSYFDERLRPITEATYSVILYQEQSMQIAKGIAGFSGAEADDLRKAIGKKNRQAMAALRERFFEGARASGTSEAVIQELWAVNEAAADYSFNRCHAACYALISYRTAWLKANYPAEYMAALISSVMSTKDKVPFFVAQCEDMGIEVLPPDVNESGHDFKVVEGNIRFGLDAVKGLGHQAVEAIIRAREKDGPFASIWDFCRRVDCQAVNKRCVESLVKCGAFDSLPGTRTRRGARCCRTRRPPGCSPSRTRSSARARSSTSATESGGAEPAHQDLPVPALADDRKQLNEWEKETLGLFLSSHPLKEVRHALRAKVECSVADLAGKKDGEWVTVGGMIAECKRIRTKKGDPMLFATLDDLEGQVELLVFNSAYAANADKVDAGQDRDRARPGGPQGGGGDQARGAGGHGLRAERRGAPPGRRAGRQRGGAAAPDAAGVARRARQLPGGPQGGRLPPPRRPRAAAGRGGAPARARRRLPGHGVERLPVRAVGPPRRLARDRVSRGTRSTLAGWRTSPARTSAELHECRQCCSFCDRVVHPAGCIASGCQYLYLYDDEDSGRRFMGCMNKVFRGEIDVELFEQAERTRHGFGGVKMSGLPLPQCRASVERAYDGYSEAFDCVNPGFFRKPVVEDADAAFDLRDGL